MQATLTPNKTMQLFCCGVLELGIDSNNVIVSGSSATDANSSVFASSLRYCLLFAINSYGCARGLLCRDRDEAEAFVCGAMLRVAAVA